MAIEQQPSVEHENGEEHRRLAEEMGTTSSPCACSTGAATSHRYPAVKRLCDRPTDWSGEPNTTSK